MFDEDLSHNFKKFFIIDFSHMLVGTVLLVPTLSAGLEVLAHFWVPFGAVFNFTIESILTYLIVMIFLAVFFVLTKPIFVMFTNFSKIDLSRQFNLSEYFKLNSVSF